MRLYRDDKCVGSVENAGTGGPNTYDLDDDVLAELVALAEAVDSEAIGYDDAADLRVETLLEAYEPTRYLNRQSATKVLFMLDGDTPARAPATSPPARPPPPSWSAPLPSPSARIRTTPCGSTSAASRRGASSRPSRSDARSP